jgi:hypothetical protein
MQSLKMSLKMTRRAMGETMADEADTDRIQRDRPRDGGDSAVLDPDFDSSHEGYN